MLVISLALTIPLLGAAVLISVQPVVSGMPTGPELTVFMAPEAPAQAAGSTAARIRSEFGEDILEVQVVSREQALAKLRNHPAWADALAVLPDNPLPDAVVVTLSGTDFASRATRLASVWNTWKNVDHVQLDSEWVQRLQALLHFAHIGLVLIASGVAVVVLATVFNTVRMQALSQREEITVARLVGATERFVRRPFLYLGAVTGGLSAILAILAATLGLAFLNDALLELARSYGTEFSLRLPQAGWLMLFVLLVAALGAFSARVSVSRNTRF